MKEIIKQRGRKFKFIKEYETYCLYEDVETGIKECFSKSELGLIIPKIKPPRKVTPDNVTYL